MIEVLLGLAFAFAALAVMVLFLNWFPEDEEYVKDDFWELEWWREEVGVD